jgi:hypothetical protein
MLLAVARGRSAPAAPIVDPICEAQSRVPCTVCDQATGECRPIVPSPCTGCCSCDPELGICARGCDAGACERCVDNRCVGCARGERCKQPSTADLQFFGVCIDKCAPELGLEEQFDCTRYDPVTDQCVPRCGPCETCRSDECVPTTKCAQGFGVGAPCLECHPLTGNCVPCGPCRPCDEASGECMAKEPCPPCQTCDEVTGACVSACTACERCNGTRCISDCGDCGICNTETGTCEDHCAKSCPEGQALCPGYLHGCCPVGQHCCHGMDWCCDDGCVCCGAVWCCCDGLQCDPDYLTGCI